MLSSKKLHLYLKFNIGRTFEMILTVLIIVALKAIQVNEQGKFGLFLGKLSALERIPVKGPDYPD